MAERQRAVDAVGGPLRAQVARIHSADPETDVAHQEQMSNQCDGET